MFLQPLVGWRYFKVTDQRTKQDFARCMKDLVEIHFPEAEKNMAEVEISIMTEQCLDRRLGSQAIVASEVGAWEAKQNAARATIDWRFTILNAGIN